VNRGMRDQTAGLPRSLLGGVVVFLALVALVLLAAPRVARTVPEEGSSDVSSKRPLQLVFTHEMEPDEVESRISIQPDVDVSFTWAERTLTIQPEEYWPEGETITLRLESGASAKIFLPILRSYTWLFQIAERRVIYLWPESGQADLYIRHLADEEAERLTQTESGVLDYSLSPDGDGVVYAAAQADGSTELRQITLSTGEDRQLYACPQDDCCQEVTHAPGGDRIAFERFGYITGQGGQPFPGPSSVWILDPGSPDESFPIGNADHITSSPNWSASGRLAYYDDTLKAIALVDIENDSDAEPFNFIPNDLGMSGSWSPDGQYLIYASIVIQDDDSEDDSNVPFYSHIYRMDVDTGNLTDLTGDAAGRVEDATPRYAPDGAWIAFTRKYLDEDRWTLGRQLWIMRADGSDPTQLTAEPNLHVSSVVWSPDAQMLVFVRKDQGDITQPIEIWVTTVDGDGLQLLVAQGYAPQWLP
jgi:Tol biopolymer transport system component